MNISKLKNWLLLGSLAVAIAGNAHALTILTTSSASYLGSIQPGTPAGDSQSESYVNQLVSMGLGASITISGNTFVRSSNVLSGMPAADLDFKNEGSLNSFNLTGTSYEYIYGKYGVGQDGGTLVWFIDGAKDTFQLPQTAFSGTQLSHTSFFNATTTTVPDGGSTVALLGLALAG